MGTHERCPGRPAAPRTTICQESVTQEHAGPTYARATPRYAFSPGACSPARASSWRSGRSRLFPGPRGSASAALFGGSTPRAPRETPGSGDGAVRRPRSEPHTGPPHRPDGYRQHQSAGRPRPPWRAEDRTGHGTDVDRPRTRESARHPDPCSANSPATWGCSCRLVPPPCPRHRCERDGEHGGHTGGPPALVVRTRR